MQVEEDPSVVKNRQGTNPGERDQQQVHVFGVDNYDEYWKVKGMRTAPRTVHHRMKDLLAAQLPKPGNVLELGPGEGHLFQMLQDTGFTMYAMDASKIVIDRIQAPPERLKIGDLNQALPDYGVRFNAIVAAKVLHHIDDCPNFMKGLKERLVPGGLLMLTQPNIVTLENRLAFLFGSFPRLSSSHKNFMTPRETVRLFEETGYRMLGVYPSRRKLFHRLSPTLFSNELIFFAQATP